MSDLKHTCTSINFNLIYEPLSPTPFAAQIDTSIDLDLNISLFLMQLGIIKTLSELNDQVKHYTLFVNGVNVRDYTQFSISKNETVHLVKIQ